LSNTEPTPDISAESRSQKIRLQNMKPERRSFLRFSLRVAHIVGRLNSGGLHLLIYQTEMSELINISSASSQSLEKTEGPTFGTFPKIISRLSTMKIKLDGKWVCSVCWADWETYHGTGCCEPAQCANCGAPVNDLDGVDSEKTPMLDAESLGDSSSDDEEASTI
jgi:hypothetical protein